MLGNFTMNDFLFGIMVLCLIVHIRLKRGATTSAIDDATNSEVRGLLEQSRAHTDREINSEQGCSAGLSCSATYLERRKKTGSFSRISHFEYSKREHWCSVESPDGSWRV